MGIEPINISKQEVVKMSNTLEFLESVEKFAKDELLEFMVLACQSKEIPLFISRAILIAIEEEKKSLYD